MRIHFMGAAGGVTGSMHLIEVNGKRILLDCGFFQGRRDESNQLNRNLPFSQQNIDCMVLSHAHIDHSGNIPLLSRGYEGDIICTLATRDLCAVMLMDSAHIQEKDAEFYNKKIAQTPDDYITPIYGYADVDKCLKQFVGINYERPFHLCDGVTLTFFDAGHVLGSAVTVLDIVEDGKKQRLVYSGDIGRRMKPILKDPVYVNDADIMLLESTYGNREHEAIETADDQLAKAVNDIQARKGKLIIPSFALERTQEIIYCLRKLLKEKRIEPIPIFIDSPLAIRVTEIFRLHPECFDEEILSLFNMREDPFDFPNLEMSRSKESSQALNDVDGPMIILSASGMCEAGRILHHLRNNIGDPNNMILIVGFQAKNTLGRKILERRSTVRIFGLEHNLEAEVRVINAYSGHADRHGLDRFANASKETVKNLYLVHGEPEQSKAMAERLLQNGFSHVHVPERGEYVDV
ncbi:MAG: MBL fold metallo-hydrolase [Candidatus Hinthialibacter antarcticus]|nr:MBL fold metallo-hydrolase [Candidatus Hinthialibacter antarcticus]